jgi:uncharacterized protein (TIGR02001 family)
MRKLLLALGAAGALAAATPATAQRAIGDTGLTATVTGTFASDYLFRGISQTRSRPAWQGNAEIEHTSGVYVGAFISNVAFQGTDARQEIDVFGGYRVLLGGVKLDFGAIGYLYPGYNAPPGSPSGTLDFAEMYVRASYEIGPVNLLSGFYYSPHYFGRSGAGYYLEGGADWKTGVWDLTLSGRLGYQWVQNNATFGVPDYLWWGVTLSREFPIERVGTIVITAGYFQTNISQSQCVPTIYGGQNICEARAYGSIAFRF